MTDAGTIAAELSSMERTELLRIAAEGDCSIPGAPGSAGYDLRRSLLAKGLLDGRRGLALSALGATVVEALA